MSCEKFYSRTYLHSISGIPSCHSGVIIDGLLLNNYDMEAVLSQYELS